MRKKSGHQQLLYAEIFVLQERNLGFVFLS